MDSTADLNAALGFVIRRIEEEATQSGEPLEEEHRFLPTNPDAPVFNAGDTAIPMDFVPRDLLTSDSALWQRPGIGATLG